ncbi:MAG: hypothetical protein ABI851_08765 [Saprospiraceae bacterium]
MSGKILILAILLPFCSLTGQSLGLGGSISAGNYSGDLTKDNKAILSQTNMGFSIYMNYYFDQYLSIRAQYEHLSVYADDALAKEDWQLKRNLNFHSHIHSFDLSGMANLRSILLPEFRRINFYAVLGLSIFNFNPIAKFNQQSYALRPLGTEGQGMKGYPDKYKLWSSALNFGLNLEYLINDRITIQTQLLFRKTNTDYLDDISNSYVDYNLLAENNGQISAALGNKIKADNGSQRGNPLDKDWYQSLSLGIQYRLVVNSANSLYKDKKPAVHYPRFKH